MKHILLSLLLTFGVGVNAQQSSEWDFHPANMDPCALWFPLDCGNCSACAEAVDEGPGFEGGGAWWSDGITVCPYSAEFMENVISVHGYSGQEYDLIGFPLYSFGSYQVDSLQVVFSLGEDDPVDSMDVLLNNVLAGSTHCSAHYPDYDTLSLVNLGCNGPQTHIMIRCYGGDQVYLKSVRAVGQPCLSTDVEEHESERTLFPAIGGINSTVPQQITVHDATGRLVYQDRAYGFVPLPSGLIIVRTEFGTRKFIL